MIRIVGGKYRHLILKQPETISTRPTMDRVREAIMSALSYDIENKEVLDLFAGSGAMGLEALSRGAKSVTFVDNNALAIKTIKENIKNLKISEENYLLKMDYESFLQSNHKVFDVVFLDPPYALKEAYQKTIDYLLKNELLSPSGVVILESDTPFEDDTRFRKNKHYKYGIVNVQIMWR